MKCQTTVKHWPDACNFGLGSVGVKEQPLLEAEERQRKRHVLSACCCFPNPFLMQ